MLSLEELKIVRDALPYNGSKLIKARFKRISASQISRTLNNPDFYRKDILDAALEVIAEYNESVKSQRTKISELTII